MSSWQEDYEKRRRQDAEYEFDSHLRKLEAQEAYRKERRKRSNSKEKDSSGGDGNMFAILLIVGLLVLVSGRSDETNVELSKEEVIKENVTMSKSGIKSGASEDFLNYVGNNKCVLQVASRKTVEEVALFLQEYPHLKPSAAAFRAKNGWIAITAGYYAQEDNEKAKIAALVRSNTIPQDSLCSYGKGYRTRIPLE